ncbi:MAG: D-alanine--D-alanine ligase [Prosthecochloris sp.]|nr:D-alanine--D-alanine ligase [Prosthecochloris sp.]
MPNVTVALLFGGKSSEHEISIISAQAVSAHIDRTTYTLFPLYISRDGRWFKGTTARKVLDLDITGLLKSRTIETINRQLLAMTENRDEDLFDFNFQKEGIDVAFPVLHGAYGEDGKVQGLLEVFAIPYTGCNVQSSSMTMDKEITKLCAVQAGIHVADYMTVLRADYLNNRSAIAETIKKRFAPPFFVKPANLGSSVGIAKIHSFDELEEALDEACRLDVKILVEKAIEGREVEVAVLGNEHPIASVPGEIEPGGDFYDFTDKYIDGSARLHIPARVDAETSARLQEEGIKAFRALGCSGMSRIDFFVEKGSVKIILNEINSIPGFTSISMYPMLMEHAGIGFTELIDRLVRFALEKTPA